MSFALFIGRQESVPLAQYYQRHDFRDCMSLRYRTRLPSRLTLESVPKVLPTALDASSKKSCLTELPRHDLLTPYEKKSPTNIEHGGVKELDVAEWTHHVADLLDSGCVSLVTSPNNVILNDDLCDFTSSASGQDFPSHVDEVAFQFFKHSNDSEDLSSEADSLNSSIIMKEHTFSSNSDKNHVVLSSEEELQSYNANQHLHLWSAEGVKITCHQSDSDSKEKGNDTLPLGLPLSKNLRDTNFADKKNKKRKTKTKTQLGESKNTVLELVNNVARALETDELLTTLTLGNERELFVGAEPRQYESSFNEAKKSHEENSVSQHKCMSEKSRADDLIDFDLLCWTEKDLLSADVGFQEVVRKKTSIKRMKNQQQLLRPAEIVGKSSIREKPCDTLVSNNQAHCHKARRETSFMPKECIARRLTLSDYERDLNYLQKHHPYDYPVDHDKVAYGAFLGLQTRLRADFSALEQRFQLHRRTRECYAK